MAPADPVLNNFLFQLVDERDDLAARLDHVITSYSIHYTKLYEA